MPMNYRLKFGANLPGIVCSLEVRAERWHRLEKAPARELLEDQRTLGVVGWLCAYVFYAAFPIVAEEIKAQAVFVRIRHGDERCAKRNPLGGINQTLEDGVLDALSAILTEACNAAQTAPSCFRSRADIVTDQDKHLLSPLTVYFQRKAG